MMEIPSKNCGISTISMFNNMKDTCQLELSDFTVFFFFLSLACMSLSFSFLSQYTSEINGKKFAREIKINKAPFNCKINHDQLINNTTINSIITFKMVIVVYFIILNSISAMLF